MALTTGALWIGVLTTVFNLALDKRLHAQADDVLRTRAEAVAATVDVRPDGRLVVREPAEDRALDSGVWIFRGGTVVEKPPPPLPAWRRGRPASPPAGPRPSPTPRAPARGGCTPSPSTPPPGRDTRPRGPVRSSAR
ncbi:hypothetical protein ACFQ2K_12350 [Streptomyces sanglieri]|uniref:Uncharacterized protein n=1 Tax=Streptomyces sanglieri TaxID=193460 RepID=A0ABW2WPY0_9ACTN